MGSSRLHAPKLPGLLQAFTAAVLIASAFGILHYTVGIPMQGRTVLGQLSVNTQVSGLLVASLAGSVVGPAEARAGDIPGMVRVETSRGHSYRPPLRYLAAIWAGNLVLLTLLFYLPIRWWHDRRYRAAVAAGAGTAAA